MFLLYIREPNQLDNFLKAEEHSEILQSWRWGEVQKADGHKIWHLGLEENNQLLAVLTAFKHHLPYGKNYLYSPLGPVFKSQSKKKTTADNANIFCKYFLPEIQKIAKMEKGIFWRIEPKNNFLLNNWTHKFKIHKTEPVQPLEELIITIQKEGIQKSYQNEQNELEALLNAMKPKTRYNIRLAEKRGVKIKQINFNLKTTEQNNNLDKNLDIFWQIIKETAQRDKFNPHPKKHYKNILKILGKNNLASLIFAEYNKKPIAANLITFFGDTAYYLHGGSRNKYRDLMAPYLLQWQGILEAKKRGLKYYNLGGIAIKSSKAKAWAGITKFKLGFGGKIITYPGAFEIVLNPFWYKIYRFYKKVNTLRLT